MMLDDLKYIHQKDAQDALGIAEKQYQQLAHEFEVPELTFPIENIVYAGMGGSALAARLSSTWPDYTVPFEIVNDYHVPSYVSEKTLFIASSYSGNTEETLSAIEEAAGAKAHIIVIAGGGKLEDIATEKNYTFIKLPKASQPRFAVLYNFKALVTVLERARFVKTASAEKAIADAAEFLKNESANWLPTVAAKDNLAKKIALDSIGRSMVIYGGPLMYPAAYKWKISFNENAKNVAWSGQYPEFSHNEFLGWTSHPVDKPYTVIDLRSSFEHPQVTKRFEVTERMLSGKRPAPIVVEAKGDTILEHLLYAVALGDFVSIYTALLNGLNPTPVDMIEKMKAQLAE